MNATTRSGDGQVAGMTPDALREQFEREEELVFLGNCRRGAVVAIAATFGGAAMDWVVYPSAGREPVWL